MSSAAQTSTRHRLSPPWGWQYLTRLGAAALIVFITALLGLKDSFSESVILVWLPAGIALSVFVLYGYRMWPGVALGVLLAHLADGTLPWVALGLAAANVFEGLAGAYLLNRFVNLDHTLGRVDDVAAVALLGALCGSIVGASLSVVARFLSDTLPQTGIDMVWFGWLMSHGLGVLLVAPVVLTWKKSQHLNLPRRSLLELGAIALLIVAVGAIAYSERVPPDLAVTISFLSSLLVFWTALRFGPRETAAVYLISTGIDLWGIRRLLGSAVAVSDIGAAQSALGLLGFFALSLSAVMTQQRRRTSELSTVLEASRIITSTLDLEESLKLVAGQMVSVMDVNGCTISQWDEKADTVVTWIEYRRDYIDWADEPGTTYRLADFPATRHVLLSRQPITINVSDPDADPAEVAHLLRSETTSLLMLPLAIGDRVIGLVELDHEEERYFSPADVRICQTLADHAAVSIENARLHAETERQLREQSALWGASNAIASSLDLNTVLTRIAEQMALAVDATSAYICSFDLATQQGTVVAEFFSPEASEIERQSDLGATYLEIEPGFLEKLRTGEHDISHIDDPDLQEGERTHLQQYGCQTVLYIPIRVRDQPLGITELWESRHRREFTPDEIALCQGISQQAAVAIENARLYEQVRASLIEKEVMLKELHHRVKNNLQVISSLLNLQAKYVDDERLVQILSDSQNRVQSMALIHEYLYKNQDLAQIDVRAYLQVLASQLSRSYAITRGRIAVQTDIDDVFLDANQAILCGLLINELVSNSLKHAFPDDRSGQIDVELHQRKGTLLELVVRDNGVGLPESVDFHQPETLGLELVGTLARRLGGTIELDRLDGTCFRMTFSGSALQEG